MLMRVVYDLLQPEHSQKDLGVRAVGATSELQGSKETLEWRTSLGGADD